jgi:hypothetical protein
MITVEIVCDENGKQKDIVEIYFDEIGLSELIDRLSLITKDKNDHLHLMTESWGLGDLAEETHQAGNRVVHHLQLSLVDVGNK